MYWLITGYIIISFLIGLFDLDQMIQQEKDISMYPHGDIGYYVFPKKITGIHNWVFLPSWIVILCWRGICWITNRIIDHV